MKKGFSHLITDSLLLFLLLLLVPLFGITANFGGGGSSTDSQQQHSNNNNYDSSLSIPMTTLSNGVDLPLVGFGVGNLQHDLIAGRIAEALADDKNTILIDTAHASSNEITVRKGIENGLRASTSTHQGPVHVVTKVWYTHLGYERTKLSVKASLEELLVPNENDDVSVDIRVHILLHWPRCDDSIPWMNCEAEEERLPGSVKKAGPPPHLHKDTAFLESWRGLEDIYTGKVILGEKLPKVESIGISNFNMDDLQALLGISRVTPHILQGNIWLYLFFPYLMAICEEHNMHFQAYNVMNGIFYHDALSAVPNAVEALEEVSSQLTERTTRGEVFSLPQIVLKWLVQRQVSVIPRTTSLEHLKENSAAAIASMPTLSRQEDETVERGVRALLTRQDVSPTLAQFVNQQVDGIVNLFWINEAAGEEVPVKEGLGPGERYGAYTHRGHKFAVYNLLTKSRSEVQVTAYHGEDQHFEL